METEESLGVLGLEDEAGNCGTAESSKSANLRA